MVIVLAAIAAAAYVVHRARTHRWNRSPDAGTTYPTAHFEPAPYASDPPAETVAMVAPVEGGIPDGRCPSRLERVGELGAPTPRPSTTRTSTLGPLELPPKRRPSAATLVTIAALVGVAAIAIGTTALVSSLDSDDSNEAAGQTTTVSGVEEAISLLSKPSTQRVPVANSGGRIILAIGANGRGVLILDGLGAAPAGKAYQAWVIKPNAKAPSSAAVFDGVETMVPLSVSVKPGAVVAITIEQAGGAPAPTQRRSSSHRLRRRRSRSSASARRRTCPGSLRAIHAA